MKVINFFQGARWLLCSCEAEVCWPRPPRTPDAISTQCAERGAAEEKLLSLIDPPASFFAFCDLRQIYGARVATKRLQGTVCKVARSCTEIETKLTTMEERIAAVEVDVDALREQCVTQDGQLTDVMWKLEDYENPQRRNNLRFLGINEGLEGSDIRAYRINLLRRAFPELANWNWETEGARWLLCSCEAEVCWPRPPRTPDAISTQCAERGAAEEKLLSLIDPPASFFAFCDLRRIYGARVATKRLQGTVCKVARSCTEIETKLTTMEERIAAVEVDVDALREQCVTQDGQLTDVMWKLEDYENPQRRNNLRFLGINEGLEGSDIRAYRINLLRRAFPELANWNWETEGARWLLCSCEAEVCWPRPPRTPDAISTQCAERGAAEEKLLSLIDPPASFFAFCDLRRIYGVSGNRTRS
ncbi:hypothetical protein NDU88_009329 [Pleurodeles waltl]|uniref:Uncharacterized protein n=1 Tax=Pleurodeles waltl TaxID=8319 RepID=A0AAV7NYR3_PLEWA|nr:hypothetical protein NDU88_009329 [Pleurodeles waltl]